MVSEVSICNQAIGRLGQDDSIVALDGNDRLVRLCRLHYADKRDALLRSYAWKFAIKRASLSPSATPPLDGYRLAYPTPIDCLRVLGVNEPAEEYRNTPLNPSWDIEGRSIVTNEAAPIKIRYISRVQDPEQFDKSFVDAFAIYLAIYLAPSLIDSTSSVNIVDLRAEFREIVADARRTGSIEKNKSGQSAANGYTSWWNGG